MFLQAVASSSERANKKTNIKSDIDTLTKVEKDEVDGANVKAPQLKWLLLILCRRPLIP